MKHIFYFPQWKWKSHIVHDRKLENIWTGFEVVEWSFMVLSRIAKYATPYGHAVYSDSTFLKAQI